MMFTSTIDQFEFLCPLAGCVVRFARFRASVENVDPLGWLFTAIRFWTWEPTVSSHDSAEPSLSPSKFRSSSLLDTLDGVKGVLARRRAVSLDLTGTLHHVNTLAFSPQGSGIYALRTLFCPEKADCVPFIGMDYKVTIPPENNGNAVDVAFPLLDSWRCHGHWVVADPPLKTLRRSPRRCCHAGPFIDGGSHHALDGAVIAFERFRAFPRQPPRSHRVSWRWFVLHHVFERPSSGPIEFN